EHAQRRPGQPGWVGRLALPAALRLSPSVFGAILDAEKAGRFRIAPAASGDLRQKQYYWPETNVLITHFLHPDGTPHVEGYMRVEAGRPARPPGPGGQIGRPDYGDRDDRDAGVDLAERHSGRWTTRRQSPIRHQRLSWTPSAPSSRGPRATPGTSSFAPS